MCAEFCGNIEPQVGKHPDKRSEWVIDVIHGNQGPQSKRVTNAKSNSDHCSFTIPRGWMKFESNGEQLDPVYVGELRSQYRLYEEFSPIGQDESMVTVKVKDEKYTTLQDVIDQKAAKFKNDPAGINSKQSISKLDGQVACLMESNYKRIGDDEGHICRYELFTIKDHKLYELTYETDPVKFYKYIYGAKCFFDNFTIK